MSVLFWFFLPQQDTMSTSEGFPASFYGEPGVLGMLSNGISAFLVLLQNFNTAHTGVAPVGVENILAGKKKKNIANSLNIKILKMFLHFSQAYI